MKDTVKTLMMVAGVGFTLIAITWIVAYYMDWR